MSRKIKIKKGINSIRFSISFLFVAFYLIIAILFLFTDTWQDLIPEKRGLIGLFLLAFAALRFYVSFKRHKGKKVKLNDVKVEEPEEAPVRGHFEPVEKV